MNEFAQQRRENRSEAENRRARGASNSRASFPLLNNRPEALAQRQLQDSFDRAPKVQSQIQLRNMLNESPRVFIQAGHQAALSRQKSAVQPKLNMSQPGDPYEQEADITARRLVSQMHATSTPEDQQALVERRQPSEEGVALSMKPQPRLPRPELRSGEDETGSQPRPRLKSADGGEDEALPGVEAAIQRARGGGEPLTNRIRQPLEKRLGADFSNVKVHTDAQSDRLSRALQARAMTTGQDIFFRRGEYNPDSRAGQELLAHELTHVVQQNGPAVQRAQPEGNAPPPAPTGLRAGHTKERTQDVVPPTHQSSLLRLMPLSRMPGVVQRVYYKYDTEKETWREVADREAQEEQIPDSSEILRAILLAQLHNMNEKGADKLVGKILNSEPGLGEVFTFYERLSDEGREEFQHKVLDAETITKGGHVASIKDLWDLIEGKEIEGSAIKKPEKGFSSSSRGSGEEEFKENVEELKGEFEEVKEEFKEQEVSTEHLYQPLTAEASLEAYNEAFEKLRGNRKQLLGAVENISGKENLEALTSAINSVSDLRKLRAKKEGVEWEKAINTLNTAGAEYVKAMLIIQKNAPKSEQGEEESPTVKALKAIEDEHLLGIMQANGLLDDPVIRSRFTDKAGKFGWTNAKGEVGEFYGKQKLEELGLAETKTKGGNRKIINVVVTKNEPESSNPTRIKEIDGLEVEISGQKYIMRGVYEIKTTTQGKSNLRGELTTSLSQKWKALRDASQKNNRIWLKEGETLKEDITNKLIVPDLSGVGVKSVGPVRKEGGPYDVTFHQDVNKITDQLACLWLQQHPEATVNDIQLGTAKESAFAPYKS